MDFDTIFCLQHSNIKWINVVRERNRSIRSFIKYGLQVNNRALCMCAHRSKCLPVSNMTVTIDTLKAKNTKAAGVTEPFTSCPILSLREWDLLLSANSRSKPFVMFHSLSPSPQSAIHFQSHDLVIANGLLSTETYICVFPPLNRDMRQSDRGEQLKAAES